MDFYVINIQCKLDKWFELTTSSVFLAVMQR